MGEPLVGGWGNPGLARNQASRLLAHPVKCSLHQSSGGFEIWKGRTSWKVSEAGIPFDRLRAGLDTSPRCGIGAESGLLPSIRHFRRLLRAGGINGVGEVLKKCSILFRCVPLSYGLSVHRGTSWHRNGTGHPSASSVHASTRSVQALGLSPQSNYSTDVRDCRGVDWRRLLQHTISWPFSSLYN